MLYSFGKFISVKKSKIFDLLFLVGDLNDVNIKGDSVWSLLFVVWHVVKDCIYEGFMDKLFEIDFCFIDDENNLVSFEEFFLLEFIKEFDIWVLLFFGFDSFSKIIFNSFIGLISSL